MGLDRSARDKRASRLIELTIEEDPNGVYLNLAIDMEKIINRKKNIWLTTTGAVSAILIDLGFEPLDGHGLFIVSSLPGILSHILAQMKKANWNEFPFYPSPEYNPEKIHSLGDDQKVYGGTDGKNMG